jgi:hypothetical protein
MLGTSNTHIFSISLSNKEFAVEGNTSFSLGESPVQLLKVPSSLTHAFSNSAITEFADDELITLGLEVECLKYRGQISQLGSVIVIDDCGIRSESISESIYRIDIEKQIDEPLAGAPVVMAGTAAAVGIIVAQTSHHLYFYGSCQLKQIGELPPTKNLIEERPREDARMIERGMEEALV